MGLSPPAVQVRGPSSESSLPFLSDGRGTAGKNEGLGRRIVPPLAESLDKAYEEFFPLCLLLCG